MSDVWLVMCNVCAIAQLYPDLKQHCNPIASMINNYSCNPPSQTNLTSDKTGYCSGFNYGNQDESWGFYNQPVSCEANADEVY